MKTRFMLIVNTWCIKTSIIQEFSTHTSIVLLLKTTENGVCSAAKTWFLLTPKTRFTKTWVLTKMKIWFRKAQQTCFCIDYEHYLYGQEHLYVCESWGKDWFKLTNYKKHIEAREYKVIANWLNKNNCIDCDLAVFKKGGLHQHIYAFHFNQCVL